MRGLALQSCCICIVLLFIAASACVAPPKDSGTSASGSKTGSSASQTSGSAIIGETATTPMYVTIETPYAQQTVSQATPVSTTTTVPPEEWVGIYHTHQSFGYNTTAVSFNLNNPPMLITFTVKPVNVTGTKEVTDPYGSRKDIKVKYDYYSPYSWFEVTVRDKASGDILQQGGFGKQYPQELNQTVKILTRGDMLIEMSGNQITADLGITVKKEGNIVNTTTP